jgi:hypothetical protein
MQNAERRDCFFFALRSSFTALRLFSVPWRAILAAGTATLPATVARAALVLTTTAALSTTTAALAGSRRTGRAQNLHLIGGENLRELGLGLFFQIGDLLLLIVGQLHLLFGKARDQMKPCRRASTMLMSTRLRAALLLGSLRIASRLAVHHRGNQPARQQPERQKPSDHSTLC